MHFSVTEKRDLIKAWVAISLAVSIFQMRKLSVDPGFVLHPALLIQAFVIYAFTVGIAFLAHEVLGHKLLAQRHRLFAEFWADDLFLLLAILTPLFSPFVFLAPGAVVISGVTRVDTYGKIAAAGPLVNIVLALVFGALLRAGVVGFTGDLVALSYEFNSWLAFFNLLPFGILDGAKVFAWDKRVWGVLTVTAALLFFGVI